MPTILEAAGAEYPKTFRQQPVLPMEGKSLMPVFKVQKHPPHDTLYWHLFGNRAVRKDKWKLVWGVTRGQWDLYDMESDRTEMHNLAATKRHLVRQMSQAWTRWAAQHEVPLTPRELPY